MKETKPNYFDLILLEIAGKPYNVLSYKAIYNFIIGARNKGKTSAFIMWRIVAFIKHGKTTTWVRRFEKEKKKARNAPIKKFMLKAIKDKFNLDLKMEDFKVQGNSLCYKGKPFIDYIKLSDARAEKSGERETTDVIVFDEFTTDLASLRRYRGNELDDFNNLFISTKRQKCLRCYFLGNKETITNPYYTYFGIKPLPLDFEGVRTYRNGAILICQTNDFINDTTSVSSDYAKKFKDLYKGTAFDNYLNAGATLKQQSQFIKKKPNKAIYFTSILVNNIPFSIFRYNQEVYIIKGFDKTRRLIFTTQQTAQYKNAYVISKSDKEYFSCINYAYKLNCLYYDSETTAEQFNEVLKLLSIA